VKQLRLNHENGIGRLMCSNHVHLITTKLNVHSVDVGYMDDICGVKGERDVLTKCIHMLPERE